MKAKIPDTVSYALLVQALINRTNQQSFRASSEFKQTLRELLLHHWSVCPPDTDEASGLYEILLQDFNNT
jgi:hypothetical protein